MSLLVSRVARGSAAQGLDKFMVPAEACKDNGAPTPADADDRNFKPQSPERTSLSEPGLPGTKLILTGSVSGVTCGHIKGAVVDVWQADARGAYDAAGFRLRGHQQTDAQGRYRFETIKPGGTGGRAPHVNLKVHVPGKADFATQVFFPDEPANARDPFFKPSLVAKVSREAGNDVATFDVVLNI